MDFETKATLSPLPRDPNSDELNGRRLFFKDDSRARRNETGQLFSKGAHSQSAAKRHLLLASGGLCCAGLIFFLGYSGFREIHPAQRSYRFALPPAQSAAEVKSLPPPNLLKPISPQEASKENAERPFATRPDTPAHRFLLKADASDQARAETCLAQVAYYEAAGEGTEGERAVAQVVLNRVHHPGFPSTICGVVYQGSDRAGAGCQFSFTCDGSMQHIPVPWLWARAKEIAQEALKGRVFAPVGHATHYHADYVLPYWADSLDKSMQIGKHIFYRLKGSLGDTRAFSQRYAGTEPPFRQPGMALVLPAIPENEQLTNALIADGSAGPAKKVEQASVEPATPLLIDSYRSTLIADHGSAQLADQAEKNPTQCAKTDDRRAMLPLKADDMRSSMSSTAC